MAKQKISTAQLKHDPLMDQYLKSSDWVTRNRRTMLMALIGVVVLLAGYFIVSAILGYQNNKAGNTLAEAFRIDQAIVQNPLPPPRPGQKAYTTEDEKHRAAYEAFDKAAAYYSDLARYYGATHQLYFDPAKAEATLRAVADGSSSARSQARLALAERLRATGKNDEAMAEYKKLKASPGDVAPLAIDLGMAQTHEALGQKKEAADLYFQVAKEGGRATVGIAGMNALIKLDPARVDELPIEDKTPSGRSGNIAMPR
ncbi:MAG: hypothetical protein ACKV2V_05890 [Blastocatellia bacterium]